MGSGFPGTGESLPAAQDKNANQLFLFAGYGEERTAAGLPAPLFQNRRNEFVVILYNHAQEKNITTDQPKDIVAFCKTPRTRKEIASYLGIESVSYAITQYVQPLVQNGQLRMTIPDKPKSTKQQYVANELL